MSSLFKLSFALLFAFVTLAGCDSSDSDDEPDPDTLEATLSSIQANIFTQSCALSGCHATDTQQSGLDLSDGNAFASLVNVASVGVPAQVRVVPSDADNSYLIWKLEGNSGIAGDQMPRGGTLLTTAQISVVRQWIDAGAMDN